MPEQNCQTTVTNKALHIQTKPWCFCEYVVTFTWYKIEKGQKVYIKITAICPQISTVPPVTGIKSLFVCLFVSF